MKIKSNKKKSVIEEDEFGADFKGCDEGKVNPLLST